LSRQIERAVGEVDLNGGAADLDAVRFDDGDMGPWLRMEQRRGQERGRGR
jgi:hypothetical protein